MTQQALLIIVDGWGLTNQSAYSAVHHANMPYLKALQKRCPTILGCSGESVGLPAGQMGNSEVGHLHMGAGRVVPQALLKINQHIAHRALQDHPVLQEAIRYAVQHKKSVHCIGLLSDGGVHAHIEHLHAICECLDEADLSYYLHAFLDGRDTAPFTAPKYLADTQSHLARRCRGQIATVMGRFYGMDRDCRWMRTKVAYDAIVHATGTSTQSMLSALQEAYQRGESDEFVKPIVQVDAHAQAVGVVRPGDVVLSFNFRTDRVQQIAQALTQDLTARGMPALPLRYLSMTPIAINNSDIKVLFAEEAVPNHLGAVLAQHKKKQLRMAETEKFPHVTSFFSCGEPKPLVGETRILYPSPKVSTYDQQPEMSAPRLTARLLQILQDEHYDFICLNLANLDMVGHTGDWRATIRACEVVDECVQCMVEEAVKKGYVVFVTADHGNAEQMKTAQLRTHTAHTNNPVPFIAVTQNKWQLRRHGTLIDIAPTLLDAMGLPIPTDMTGRSLISW